MIFKEVIIKINKGYQVKNFAKKLKLVVVDIAIIVIIPSVSGVTDIVEYQTKCLTLFNYMSINILIVSAVWLWLCWCSIYLFSKLSYRNLLFLPYCVCLSLEVDSIG